MKRMCETTRWTDPWFRNLTPTAKLLWCWLLDHCDCAGIIEPDLDLAGFQIGQRDGIEDALASLGDRIENRGAKLWIPKFIAFQFGQQLNRANKAHLGVIRRLESAGILCPVEILDQFKPSPLQAPCKPLQRGCQAPQEKEKEKEQEKEKEKEKDLEPRDVVWCPMPEDAFTSQASQNGVGTMLRLEAKIQGLKPGWNLPMTRAEQEELMGAARALEGLSDEDWTTIREYLGAKLEKGSPGWQPRTRSKFISTAPDVWTHASEWKRKQPFKKTGVWR
jgi:hypothetical protein